MGAGVNTQHHSIDIADTAWSSVRPKCRPLTFDLETLDRLDGRAYIVALGLMGTNMTTGASGLMATGG